MRGALQPAEMSNVGSGCIRHWGGAGSFYRRFSLFSWTLRWTL